MQSPRPSTCNLLIHVIIQTLDFFLGVIQQHEAAASGRGGPLRQPFMIVPDIPAAEEEEEEKERVDAVAASFEVRLYAQR